MQVEQNLITQKVSMFLIVRWWLTNMHFADLSYIQQQYAIQYPISIYISKAYKMLIIQCACAVTYVDTPNQSVFAILGSPAYCGKSKGTTVKETCALTNIQAAITDLSF